MHDDHSQMNNRTPKRVLEPTCRIDVLLVDDLDFTVVYLHLGFLGFLVFLRIEVLDASLLRLMLALFTTQNVMQHC